MKITKTRIKLLKRISLKTIFFNFKYLPFKQAIFLPFFISKKVYMFKSSGIIKLECPPTPGIIKIGFGEVGIFDDKVSRTIWNVAGTIIFKGKTEIGHGSKISVENNGLLIFGENMIITAETSIISNLKIQFGKNCMLSWDILIMDTDIHTIKNECGIIINAPKPIVIGDNVWIGCRCLILKNSRIPNNSIIGAYSLVNKPLEKENCIYAGNPAKFIKEKISWEM